jgi:hypothetical protein
MTISREEFDDLHARVTAQRYLMNALLIALLHKNLLANADVEVMVESTLSSMSQLNDPSGAVAEYLEDFRFASRQDE